MRQVCDCYQELSLQRINLLFLIGLHKLIHENTVHFYARDTSILNRILHCPLYVYTLKPFLENIY